MTGAIITAADVEFTTGYWIDPVVRSFNGALYAGYMLGSETERPHIEDWSNFERDLVSVGNPTLAARGASVRYSTAIQQYFECPFTGDDLADRLGAATIMAVVRAASSTEGFWFAASYDSDGRDNYSFGSRGSGPNTPLVGYHRISGVQGNPTISIVGDTHYGTGWEFVALAVNDTEARVYRRWAGEASMQTATDGTPTVAPVGNQKFRIGGAHGTPQGAFSFPGQIAAAYFFEGDLGGSGVQEGYEDLRDFFSTRGIDID
jgi:hypothetical protein